MKSIMRRALPAALLLSAAGAGVAHAHEGTGSGSSGDIHWNTWVLLLFLLLAAAAAVAYWKRRHRPEGRLLKALTVLAGIGAVLMGAFNASGMWEEHEEDAPINLIHIHGLSYEQNGSRVILATHDGIKWYGDGKWSLGEGEPIDYMGFAPYEGGFYSSGHPGAGSKLQNPIGLVKSTDEGKTLQVLALHGQEDFHLLAVSYRKGTIYGVNSEPNEVLKHPGLYFTADEGKTWTKCAMNGFTGDMTALAVHPDNGDIVAVGSRDGLYLSRNKGQTFERLVTDAGVSALSFDKAGLLNVGLFKDRPSLVQLDPDTKKSTDIPLPELKEDAIAFAVHHPDNLQERVITTYEQDVYRTEDGGATWFKLADNGKTKPAPEPAAKAGAK